VLCRSVVRIRHGSVEYSWTNSSLLLQLLCPSDEILRLLRFLVTSNDDRQRPASSFQQDLREEFTIRAEFATALRPYRVLKVWFEPLGSCRERMTGFISGRTPEWRSGITGDVMARDTNVADGLPKELDTTNMIVKVARDTIFLGV